MSHTCVSLQSFLVVRDSVTSQPSLLCVSAGAQNEEVFDYNIKCTGAGRIPPHANICACVCVCALGRACMCLCLCVCLCDQATNFPASFLVVIL